RQGLRPLSERREQGRGQLAGPEDRTAEEVRDLEEVDLHLGHEAAVPLAAPQGPVELGAVAGRDVVQPAVAGDDVEAADVVGAGALGTPGHREAAPEGGGD